MNSRLARLLVHWAVLALGVLIATRVVPGIHCSDLGSLVAVTLVLSLFNAVLRPLLLFFAIPFIIVTMGLGIVVINAILFFIAGRIVDGFTVAGFWPAVGGSIVVSLTNIFVGGLVRAPGPPPPRGPPRPPGGVIDI
jgi:putative membrane protein